MVMLNFLADPNCSLDPSRGDGDLGRVEPDGGVSYRNLGVVEGDAGCPNGGEGALWPVGERGIGGEL